MIFAITDSGIRVFGKFLTLFAGEQMKNILTQTCELQYNAERRLIILWALLYAISRTGVNLKSRNV
jgi:hypothetical protein